MRRAAIASTLLWVALSRPPSRTMTEAQRPPLSHGGHSGGDGVISPRLPEAQ